MNCKKFERPTTTRIYNEIDEVGQNIWKKNILIIVTRVTILQIARINNEIYFLLF